jgi:hypothetical protein
MEAFSRYFFFFLLGAIPTYSLGLVENMSSVSYQKLIMGSIVRGLMCISSHYSGKDGAASTGSTPAGSTKIDAA